MQTSNRILDDLARVANGAVSTLTGIKGELEAMIRHQLERILADRDTVPREEFEAVKAMAAKARAQQEKLEKRVAALEASWRRGAGQGCQAAARQARRQAGRGTRHSGLMPPAAPAFCASSLSTIIRPFHQKEACMASHLLAGYSWYQRVRWATTYRAVPLMQG